MADVYGTQEVAVKIVAWLDKDTFQDADGFVDKFAADLQKKLESGLKKHKISAADILDVGNLGDSAAKSAAEAGRRVVDSIKKATAGVDAGKLLDFSGAAKYVNTSGIQRSIEKLQAEFKVLLQLYEEAREKSANGVFSAKEDSGLWKQGDKIRKMYADLRKEMTSSASAGALDQYKAQMEMINEQVSLLLGTKPVPPDFVNMTEAERQLAVINSIKDAYREWELAYKGSKDDDAEGLRIAERLNKAIAAYDKLLAQQDKLEEKSRAIAEAEKAREANTEAGKALPDFKEMSAIERLEYRLNLVADAEARVREENIDADRKARELIRLADEYDRLAAKIHELKNAQEKIKVLDAAPAPAAPLSYEELLANGKEGNHYSDVSEEYEASEKEIKAINEVMKETTSTVEQTHKSFNDFLKDLNGETKLDTLKKELSETKEALRGYYTMLEKSGGDPWFQNHIDELAAKYVKLNQQISRLVDKQREQAEAEKDAAWLAKHAVEMRASMEKSVDGANKQLLRKNNYDGVFDDVFDDEEIERVFTFRDAINSVKDAISGITGRFVLPKGAFSDQADDLRAKIEGVKEKMDDLSHKRIATDTYKRLAEDIRQTENALKKLIDRQNLMKEKGVDETSQNYRNLQTTIDYTTGKLKNRKDAADDMQKKGTATISGADTGAYKKLEEQLARYEARLQRVASKGASLAGKALGNVGSAISRGLSTGLKTAGRFFKAIGNGAKSASRHMLGLNRRTTSTSDVLKKAYATFTTYMRMFRTRVRRSIVSEMFQDMKNNFGQMAQVSTDFNASVSGIINTLKMLGAQILAIAEPVITTFGPMLSYVGDLAAKVADTLAQFMARATGRQEYIKATKGNYDLAKSMEESESKTKKATKAAKEYKNTVLSFDELHKLNGIDDDDASAITGFTGAQLQKAQTQATAINDLADRIYNAFKRHDYKGAGSAMADAVAAGFGWLKDTVGWTANGEKITKTLGNVTDTVNGFIAGWHSEDIGAAIGDVINTLIHSLDILTDPDSGIDFKGAGLKLGETLASAFANTHWETGGKAVMNGIQGIAKFITGIVTAPNFGAELGLAFREGVRGMTDAFDEQTWADLISGTVDAFSDFLNYAFANPDEYGELGEKMGNAITKGFEQIDREKLKSGIKSALTSIGNIVKEFSSADWGGVGDFFGDVLFGNGGITQSVIDAAYNVGGALGKGILDGMKGVFKEAGKSVLEYSASENTQARWAGGLMKLGTRILNSGDTEKQRLAWIDDVMAEDVSFPKLREAILEAGKIVDELAIDFYEHTGHKITGDLDGFFAQMWQGANSDEAYNYFLKYGENTAAQVKAAIEGDWAALGQLLADSGAEWSEAADLIKQLVENQGQDAVTAVRSAYDDALATVNAGNDDVIDRIRSVLSDITGLDWKGTGENVVDGLTSGVNNNSNFAVSLVNMAIDAYNKVKRFFGINSPSTLMRDEIGQYIPEGIAVGIDSHADAVIDSMESLGDMTVGVAGGMTDNVGRSGGDGILQGAILSGMRQAVMEAAMTMQNGNDTEGGDIILVVDSEELARASARGQRRIDKRVSPTVSFS